MGRQALDVLSYLWGYGSGRGGLNTCNLSSNLGLEPGNYCFNSTNVFRYSDEYQIDSLFLLLLCPVTCQKLAREIFLLWQCAVYLRILFRRRKVNILGKLYRDKGVWSVWASREYSASKSYSSPRPSVTYCPMHSVPLISAEIGLLVGSLGMWTSWG